MKNRATFLILVIAILINPLGELGFAKEYKPRQSFSVESSSFRYLITHESNIKSVIKLKTGWLQQDQVDPAEYLKQTTIWIKAPVSVEGLSEPAIFLSGLYTNLVVYADSVEIVNSDEPNFVPSTYFSRVISLKNLGNTKSIYIKLTLSGGMFLGQVMSLNFGESRDMLTDQMSELYTHRSKIIINSLLGGTTFFIGFFALFVFFLQFKRRIYPILIFSLITLISFIEYMWEPIGLTGMLGLNFLQMTVTLLMAFLLIAPLFVLLLTQIYGLGWKKSYWYIFICSLLISVTYIAVFWADYHLFLHLPSFGLVYSLTLIALIIFFFPSKFHKKHNAIPFIIGIILFLISGIIDFAIETLPLPATGFGIMAMLIAFTYVMYQYYVSYESRFNIIQEEVQRKEIELSKIKEDNIRSQYEALKNQINPHFMFNTFSTLISVIEQDKDIAVDFVQKLSNVYRYVLLSKDKPLVPLSEELNFVESFGYLLQKRFGTGFVLNIDVPLKYHHFSILPLSIQMLIENAVKHNIISEKKPTTMDIYIEQGSKYLVVANNLQKRIGEVPSTKMGLKNITERYSFFTERKVFITKDEEKFVVKIPLLGTDDED